METANSKNPKAAPAGSVQGKKAKYDRIEKEKGGQAAALEMIRDIHRSGQVPVR
jgi:hypothetical protein